MTRDMILFMAGALLVLGFNYAVPQSEAAQDGWLTGWEVKIGNRIICRDPWVWNRIKEIECDR